ncbi:hypothetical protein ACIBL8_44025 [Streptomyces sp. NPDC050523]|uniref:hypothetical protein n=1 Tax=Streptomyces sp. NPDC050523 TaxID=3365622 RepID=UPI0037A702A6
MSLRTRAIAITVLAATAFGALGVPAMAAPMPWETSKTPTVITHHTTSRAVAGSGTVTALCGAPCFE